MVKEMLKSDVLVLVTGGAAFECGTQVLMTPESAAVNCGPGLAEVCETVGIPPVLNFGSTVDNSRILLTLTRMVNAGGLGNDICDLPAAFCSPGWVDEMDLVVGQYAV